jgi:hypothetical protein
MRPARWCLWWASDFGLSLAVAAPLGGCCGAIAMLLLRRGHQAPGAMTRIRQRRDRHFIDDHSRLYWINGPEHHCYLSEQRPQL